MLKVQITHAKVTVGGQYVTEGSVLAGTIQATVPKITSRLEVESPDDPEKVAKVLRAAENGCYAMQAVRNPTPLELTTLVNGQPFDPGA
jgi:hypothetical protein